MITRAARRKSLNKGLRWTLLGLAILLFGVVFWQILLYLAFLKGDGRVNVDGDIRSMLTESDLAIPVGGRIEDSVNRPLFFTTRKPFLASGEGVPEEIVDAPAVEQKLISEILSSVMIAGNQKMAFLEGKNGVIRLEEGMQYQGWTVVTIEVDQIKISDGNSEQSLPLRKFAIAQPIEPKKLGSK